MSSGTSAGTSVWRDEAMATVHEAALELGAVATSDSVHRRVGFSAFAKQNKVPANANHVRNA